VEVTAAGAGTRLQTQPLFDLLTRVEAAAGGPIAAVRDGQGNIDGEVESAPPQRVLQTMFSEFAVLQTMLSSLAVLHTMLSSPLVLHTTPEYQDLKEIATALNDVASIEVPPQMEGRTMLVVMAPNKGGVKKKEKGDQAPAEKEPQPSK